MTTAMESFADRVQWVISERVGTAEEWATRIGKSGGYVRTMLSRAKADDSRPPAEVLRQLADAAEVDLAWLDKGIGTRPASAPRQQPARARASRPTPANGTPLDTANPLLRALLLAWRGSDCDPEDYEALASIIRGGAGQLAATTDDQASAILTRWLGIARRLRLAGKPVTFETLAYEGMRPAAVDAQGASELASLGGTAPASPVRVPSRRRESHVSA